MHTSTFAIAALAAVVVNAQAPAGCSPSFSGDFEITAVNSTVTKRDLTKRACGDPGSLTISLSNGVLTDEQGRTGYIASNFQFQFDKPVQAGALRTSGFSACTNGSLALGDTAVFWECLSGSFFNLYDRDWAPQCQPILIEMLPCSASDPPTVGQGGDGQPTGTAVAPVSQISDGQPQGGTPVPISQISDGQPQVPTQTAISQISDGQPQAPTGGGAPVSQISDGQPQAPTGQPAPVSQISDGQPQAPTGQPAPVSQISDGQPQAPTGQPAPVSQISDGQPQAPTGQPAPISQISDGQPQAPTGQPAPITQISDGQPQAPTGQPITQISDGQPQAPTGSPQPITQISDGQPQAPNATAPATSPIATVPASGADNVRVVGSSLAAVAAIVAVFLL